MTFDKFGTYAVSIPGAPLCEYLASLCFQMISGKFDTDEVLIQGVQYLCVNSVLHCFQMISDKFYTGKVFVCHDLVLCAY